MKTKVVLIGGGSYTWTPKLSKDLFLRENLKGSELVLVDLNKKAAKTMQAYCNKILQKIGTEWKVTISDLEPALEDADIVCICISTPPRASGGLEAMSNDYHIPEEFGIYHAVGDTVGPGGISRTLRNIPVFIDIARKMEKHCPEAWLIHVTNPLSQLTRAVAKETSIKSVGLCHNFAGTMDFLASFLGVNEDYLDATSIGVNHYTWLKDISYKGKPIKDQLTVENYLEYEIKKRENIKGKNISDKKQALLDSKEVLRYYLNFELQERFGYFPTGSSCHVVENLPYYCNNEDAIKKHHILRKGVLPRRLESLENDRQEILDILDGKKELPELKLSQETLSGIVQSLYSDKPSRAVVAMPNKGQIDNLPEDVVVETWAQISSGGISPVMSGSIPDTLIGSMQTIINEQELTVEAALEGNREKVIQAMAISPMVHNKDIVEELTDKLLNANKDYLPQFF